MAFIRFDEYSAKALEKGLSYSCTKPGDFRWSNYGADNKKYTSDNEKLGAVAYVKFDDPGNPDPVLAAKGTVTKIFFKCEGADTAARYAAVETTLEVENAVDVAAQWVMNISTFGKIVFRDILRTKVPPTI